MSKLVMGLLVVQLVGGAYMFMSLASSNSAHSTARATRLPSAAVFGHASLGLAAPAVWIGYLTSDWPWLTWVTLASVLLSVAGGLFMLSRTAFRPDSLGVPASDPSDVRVVEKQIPRTVLVGHGLTAGLIVVCILVVALGA